LEYDTGMSRAEAEAGPTFLGNRRQLKSMISEVSAAACRKYCACQATVCRECPGQDAMGSVDSIVVRLSGRLSFRWARGPQRLMGAGGCGHSGYAVRAF
jgi:hypothetical protein